MENTQILKLKEIHPAKEVCNGKKSHKAMSVELPFCFTLFYRFNKENFMLLLLKNKVKYTLFSKTNFLFHSNFSRFGFRTTGNIYLAFEKSLT